MHTEISQISDLHACRRALRLLRDQQVIAAPTDTVYGVMCRYDSALAIARLYAVKNRPLQKAIPVLISDAKQLNSLVQQPLPRLAHDLIRCLWPGPLTLILPAQPHLPAILIAGQRTVAVRMPDHDALRALIRQAGPLAATSANLSGVPETHTAHEVIAQLYGRIPLVLADPNDCRCHTLDTASASTIVDLGDPSSTDPTIVREGPVADKVRDLSERARQFPC